MKRTAMMVAAIAVAFSISSTAAVAAQPMNKEIKHPMVLAANPSDAAIAFTDLAGYDWARDAINDMATKGIIMGIGQGLYGPAEKVTRVEFASMAIRALGDMDKMVATANALVAADPASYTSLEKLNLLYLEENDQPKWSNQTIFATQSMLIFDQSWGVSAKEWEQMVTRAEMAAIVISIAEGNGMQFAVKEGIEQAIGDYADVRDSACKEFILKAYSNGILVGTNATGDYMPADHATRAEAAVIIQRGLDPTKRKEVTVKPGL